MKPALAAEGRAALAAVMAASPLLAFDFDGTLAPIVARPADARVPLPLSRRLAKLALRWPVAVVTGRAVDDVAGRLGFEPAFVVGNHGVEDPCEPQRTNWGETLDPVRRDLREHAHALAESGVQIEDKGLSIALHYRLAPDRPRAVDAIDAALRAHDADAEVLGGKSVVNVMPVGAPDKGDALRALVRRVGAGAALFVGDDLNDESAFAKAPAGWMTVRVGHGTWRSRARYYLDTQAQLTALVQSALDLSAPG